MTETPTRHRAPIALDWRHIALGVALLADGVYAALLVSGVAIAGHDQFVAPQLNQLFVAALGVCTVTSVGLVLTGCLSRRVDDAFVVLSVAVAQLAAEVTELRKIATALTGEAARIKDRVGMRTDDDPTVPLINRRRPAGQAYLSANVASGGRIDLIAQRVEQVAETAEKALATAATRGGAAGASKRRRRARPNQRHDEPVPIDEKFQAYLAGREDRRADGSSGEDAP